MEVGWAISLLALLVYSGRFGYRRIGEQPAHYGQIAFVLRVSQLVLLGVLVNQLYQINRINAALEVLGVALGSIFAVMYGTYLMQIRGRASRMSTTQDSNEVRRYRRTARWTIDLEIKEGQRRR
jgi:drug/metabolite transporter (DMT)-like permease